MTSRPAAVRVLALAGAAGLAWALWIAATGGLSINVLGLSVRSTSASRPFWLGALAMGAAIWLHGPHQTIASLRRGLAALTAIHGVLTLAIAIVVVSLAGNSWTASGPDAFAYLSQAALWRDGEVRVPIPLAARAPWPDPIVTFTPWGYRPDPLGSAALVPVTAPALPLVMAGLQAIAGHCAAFLITPIAGAALVWATWLLGVRVRSRAVGLMSAWLVATSAPVLFMLMWPMTDIPATALTALMLWLLLADSTRSAAIAGAIAAIGILTRPNFVVTAAAVGGWLIADAWLWRERARRWVRVAAFVAGVVPGIALTLLVNASWYGSAIASGYGSASKLFGVDRIPGNTGRYVQWALESAPWVFVGLAVIVVPLARVWRDARGRRAALLLAAVTASLAVVYLPYEPYDQWWYLRFFLPAWPAVAVATAMAVEALRGDRRGSRLAGTALVVAAGVAGVVFAAAHLVFKIGVTERRYATIAKLVDTMTEPDAVILTMPHSGSVRYYAGRDTLRYDVLNEAWIDRTIAWLAAEGRHPYVLLEDWERPRFEARFAKTYPEGTKPWAAVFNWQSKYTLGWVWLYDPLRRAADVVTPRPDDRLEDLQPLCAPPKDAGRIRGR